MARKLTTPEANIAAESRAVEDGHHALVMPGGWVKVVSDTHHGKWYEVVFLGHIDGLILFVCRPHGPNAYRDDHLYAASALPGRLPCKHAALAARRLEREGLAVYDAHGRWQVTELALSLLPAPRRLPDDPLEGLPT